VFHQDARESEEFAAERQTDVVPIQQQQHQQQRSAVGKSVILFNLV